MSGNRISKVLVSLEEAYSLHILKDNDNNLIKDSVPIMQAILAVLPLLQEKSSASRQTAIIAGLKDRLELKVASVKRLSQQILHGDSKEVMSLESISKQEDFSVLFDYMFKSTHAQSSTIEPAAEDAELEESASSTDEPIVTTVNLPVVDSDVLDLSNYIKLLKAYKYISKLLLNHINPISYGPGQVSKSQNIFMLHTIYSSIFGSTLVKQLKDIDKALQTILARYEQEIFIRIGSKKHMVSLFLEEAKSNFLSGANLDDIKNLQTLLVNINSLDKSKFKHVSESFINELVKNAKLPATDEQATDQVEIIFRLRLVLGASLQNHDNLDYNEKINLEKILDELNEFLQLEPSHTLKISAQALIDKLKQNANLHYLSALLGDDVPELKNFLEDNKDLPSPKSFTDKNRFNFIDKIKGLANDFIVKPFTKGGVKLLAINALFIGYTGAIKANIFFLRGILNIINFVAKIANLFIMTRLLRSKIDSGLKFLKRKLDSYAHHLEENAKNLYEVLGTDNFTYQHFFKMAGTLVLTTTSALFCIFAPEIAFTSELGIMFAGTLGVSLGMAGAQIVELAIDDFKQVLTNTSAFILHALDALFLRPLGITQAPSSLEDFSLQVEAGSVVEAEKPELAQNMQALRQLLDETITYLQAEAVTARINKNEHKFDRLKNSMQVLKDSWEKLLGSLKQDDSNWQQLINDFLEGQPSSTQTSARVLSECIAFCRSGSFLTYMHTMRQQNHKAIIMQNSQDKKKPDEKQPGAIERSLVTA